MEKMNESIIHGVKCNPQNPVWENCCSLRPVLKPLRQPAFLVNRGIGYKYVLLHLKVQNKTEG